MRKTALLLAAMVAAAAVCPWIPASGAAAGLEPTDSGAPSAIVIFPVGEKPNPNIAAMPPVAFNHVVHEKWMAKTGRDCMVCHHTGDPVACTNCHTVEGSAKGNFVNLERAMHATEIAPRPEHTPASCVSCHIHQTTQRECAGCHGQLVRNARKKDSWCNVCHTIAPSMTPEMMAQGVAGKLSESKNEKVAEETALARKPVQYWSDQLAPSKVKIDALARNYGPCVFNHRHHALSMRSRIDANALASAFHTSPGTICATCHHNSPPSATPPKCSSCHGQSIDWIQPARPKLMAAYHLQCMSCHKDMKVARPRNTDCATCHKPRQTAGVLLEGLQ